MVATSDVRCPPSAELDALIQQFRGEIQQVPPMYSALKHKGQRLYKLAREGVVVERKARPVTLYELLLNERSDSSFALWVSCSKGTYVRTLVEDVAAAFGGLAHVTSLRRSGLGPFELGASVSLDDLRALAEAGDDEALMATVQPIDCAIKDWPSLTVSPETAFFLKNGQPVKASEAPATGLLRLYEEDGHFLGTGEVIADGRVAPRRLFRLPKTQAG